MIHIRGGGDRLFDVDPSLYASRGSTPAATSDDEARPIAFPDSGLPGWTAPRETFRYDAANLHVKINGRAEAFLTLGARRLTFGTYRFESDARRAIDVYCYEFDTEEHARAMFRSERPPDVSRLDVGDVGYQVGGAVFFVKRTSYVQVLPFRLDPDDAAAALNIARRLADGTADRGAD